MPKCPRALTMVLIGGLFAGHAHGQCLDQRLPATGVFRDAWFGETVRMDVDRCAVAAPGDDYNYFEPGTVHVFKRELDGWHEEAVLEASDKSDNDLFGRAFDIEGKWLIVGAVNAGPAGHNSGAAYVFELTPAGWTEVDQLLPAAIGKDDWFGAAVSLSGDRLAITSFGKGIFMYELQGGTWVEDGVALLPSDAPVSFFGASLSLSGKHLLAGAYQHAGQGVWSGAAYLFERVSGIWMEVVRFTEPVGEAYDLFGVSVSLDGDKAVIGSPGDDDGGVAAGAFHVYEPVGPGWVQTAKLLGPQAGLSFGYSVAVWGDRILAGVPWDGSDREGSVSAYRNQGAGWLLERTFVGSDTDKNDYLGLSVALHGDVGVAGAPGKWFPKNKDAGAAYVFDLKVEMGTAYCDPAVPNTSGEPALLCAIGSVVVADADLTLHASKLPAQQWGYLLASQDQGFLPGVGGSQGNLCLGGQIGRFVKQVMNSGANGRIGFVIDLSQLPPPLNVPVLPGDTWNFQVWFRDQASSNFTQGLELTFQ